MNIDVCVYWNWSITMIRVQVPARIFSNIGNGLFNYYLIARRFSKKIHYLAKNLGKCMSTCFRKEYTVLKEVTIEMSLTDGTNGTQ